MKPYTKKPARPGPDPKKNVANKPADISELELEDPVRKDVEGFDPYNTGIFRIDKGPWKGNKT